MKHRKWLVVGLTVGVCLSFWGPASADLLKEAQEVFRPVKAKKIRGNPATPLKIDLGKILYFDPRLSSSGLISCNTCHNVGMGGGDFQEVSVGHKWQKGPRNAPTVLNSVFHTAQFWDGRARDLAEQAKGPVQASVEMNNTPEMVLKTLNSMPEYQALFRQAFPDEKDPVTFDNMAKAIEVFEATLITPNSRFDQFLGGNESALAAEEKEGLRVFMNKECSKCHGYHLGGTSYSPFGVIGDTPPDDIMTGDKGRYKVTRNEDDIYKFKVPSLRNIEITQPYFHSGKVWDLREAVAIMGSAQLGHTLNEKEIDQIVAFLKTTTGEQPKVEYPILPKATMETPRPRLD